MKSGLNYRKLSRLEQQNVKGGISFDPSLCNVPMCYSPEATGGCGSCGEFKRLPESCIRFVLVDSRCEDFSSRDI